MRADSKPYFALGTAQLGIPYGIANKSGMPTQSQAIAIVRSALNEGVRTIDTARAYGDSEERIGLALQETEARSVSVVTKLDPLDNLPDSDRAVIERAAALSVERSRAALRRDRLDVLLLHRPEHRTRWNGVIWQQLLNEREAGRIDRIGVSVGNPDEALAALDDAQVEHIQMPFNLLDGRWKRTGVIDALRRRPDVTIHVRSVFLQGLLAGHVGQWPMLSGAETNLVRDRLTELTRKLNRESLADLALAYVRGQTWLHAAVIGVETLQQITTNIHLFGRPALSTNECELVESSLPPIDPRLVSPPQWRR